MTEIVRYRGNQHETTQDTLTEEEPLEIRIDGEAFAVTMRSPGDDFALVTGLLFAEGLLSGRDDIEAMGYGTEENDPHRTNLVQVALSPSASTQRLGKRPLTMSASCGVCGKADLSDLYANLSPLSLNTLTLSPALLYSLPTKLRSAQEVFQKTGGLHAAGLFDTEGNLLALQEDVGRHNAVDKVIGEQVMHNALPLTNRILLVSGRVSFEIVQKAVRARIPVLCAVSAPSTLAVTLAHAMNLTLIGFLRNETMNIYTRAERVE